jgi:hypothetical protein
MWRAQARYIAESITSYILGDVNGGFMKHLLLALAIMVHGCHALAQPLADMRTDYELVAASQTTQVCGPVGGTGDILDKVIIVPATTAAGTVSIKDGANTAINIFVAGTLSDLKPHVILIGARSSAGAWQITTGANVSAICVGRFK